MMRKIAFFSVLLLCACVGKENNTKKLEIILLSEAIQKDPTNTILLLDRANYNKELNNLESALFDLTQCVKLDSLNPDFHYLVAEIYFELSKRKNANGKYPSLVKNHLTKAIVLNDNDHKSQALLGELMLAYAKYKEAIDCFNYSLKIEYNQAKTHMLMGYAFKQLGQDDNAINCFRNSVNVNPEFKEGFVQLGQMYHVNGDTSAVVYYNNALQLDSTDEMTLYNKALFYQSTMNWNAALEAYSELHKVNFTHSSGHYNIGFIHMELGLYDVASNNFSDAIYSNSEFFEAYYSRGNCFETLGNIKQAEIDYKRAIEINPKYTFAVEALEQLQLQNKKYKKL
jgi:tetratricopeptide (TPR) repeat protein